MKRLIFGSYTKIELRVSFKKILMMFLAIEMPSIYQIIWKQERKKRRIGFRKQERLEEEKKESIRSLWKWLWKGHENHGRKWKTTVGLFSRSISAASEGKKKSESLIEISCQKWENFSQTMKYQIKMRTKIFWFR